MTRASNNDFVLAARLLGLLSRWSICVGVLGGTTLGCSSGANLPATQEFARVLRAGNLERARILCCRVPDLTSALLPVDGVDQSVLPERPRQQVTPESGGKPVTKLWPPLYVASWYGHAAVVEFLLDQDNAASFYQHQEAFDNHDGTPLHWEILRGQRELATRMVGLGLFVNATPRDAYDSPLWVATDIGDTRVLAALIRAGANLEIGSWLSAAPPLYAAARNGDLKCVSLLVEAGANINRVLINPVATTSQTPIVGAAALSGKREVVEYLLAKGAERQYDARVLRCAVAGGSVEILQLLYDHGYRTDPEFEPLVPSAMWSGNIKMVDWLLEHGFSPGGFLRDVGGWYAIYLGTKNETMAAAFMGYRISHAVKEVYPEDGLAFTEAIITDKRDWVAYFLSVGLDPNRGTPWPPRADKRRTVPPLHLAVEHDRYEIAELLLKRGASLEAKDTDGLTPVALAEKLGRDKILKLLREAEAARKHGAIEKPAATHTRCPAEVTVPACAVQPIRLQ